MSSVKASLLATAVLVIAAVALLFRRALLASHPVPVVAQVVAAGLMLWARLTFGLRSFHAGANPTGGGIVSSGPYRFLRHPIYSAILLFVWAGVASHFSVPNLALGLLATAGTAVRIWAEERLLLERYPEYRAYAARTRRLIPFVF